MNQVRKVAALAGAIALVAFVPASASAKHSNHGRHCGKNHPVKKSCTQGHHGHHGVKK